MFVQEVYAMCVQVCFGCFASRCDQRIEMNARSRTFGTWVVYGVSCFGSGR